MKMKKHRGYLTKLQGRRVEIQIIIRPFLQNNRRRGILRSGPLDRNRTAQIRLEGRGNGRRGRRRHGRRRAAHMGYDLWTTGKQTEGTERKRRARRTRLSSLPWREANGSGVVLGEAGGDGGGARVAATGAMRGRRLTL